MRRMTEASTRLFVRRKGRWFAAMRQTAAAGVLLATAATAAPPVLPGDRMLSAYFRHETAVLAERCLADIQSLEDWVARRAKYRRQLQEMLGLWPLPERTDLKPVVTGRIEHDEFTVEKLYFQASPQLYVTANLYRPKQVPQPVPAILYVCGHSRQTGKGVSYGNKTGYQHHGAWFARNGYVCLMIDTVQLGEIEGLHHGTYREGLWWWNSRGYTPAGVEAWFGIRALDYLCTRPEVDVERIGLTGRSGGGSYTWTVAALDDRVKVAAPVAGITDLHNQVVDGCVAGHCDCMFFVNTYRWDFPQLAALIAPRPLLIGNTDKDGIFPLDGVVRLHEKVRRIYRLHGAENNLGLLITEGPHQDTQDLQVPVFRWFNRFLKHEQPLIEMAAKKFFEPEQLRVFDQLPADQINTGIHFRFVPKARPPADAAAEPPREALLATLQAKTFAGWPQENPPLAAEGPGPVVREGLRFSRWEFTSQPGVRLRLYVLEPEDGAAAGDAVHLNVLDAVGWSNWLGAVRTGFGAQLVDELSLPHAAAAQTEAFARLKTRVVQSADHGGQAYFAPRGVGGSAWSGDAGQQTQIRRRFMLLGQTLEGMRVWDIRRAVQALRAVNGDSPIRVTLQADGPMAMNAGWAALFEPEVRLASTNAMSALTEFTAPDYLNLYKVMDFPRVMEWLGGAHAPDRAHATAP